MQGQRDRDFMAMCRRLMDDPGLSLRSARQLAAEAVKQQAPLYYVTYDYALRALRSLRKAGQLPGKNEEGKRKWAEIERRVGEMERRLGLSDGDALSRVLSGGASSFFISAPTALRLFHRIRRRNKN